MKEYFPEMCLVAVAGTLIFAAISKPIRIAVESPQSSTIRETVTNWNQVGYLRLGNSNYEVLQGATFTNYVMKTKFEGREMSMVLKSDQGPVLTNWCDLRCIPTGGPGPVWTITPPTIPLPERPK